MEKAFNGPSSNDQRIDTGIARGKSVEIKINGTAVQAYEGETIAAVLAASGMRQIRQSPQHHDPRGLYCCMGACHGCLVTINGQPNIRACVTPVEPGQEIILQDGFGRLDPDSPEPAPAELIRKKVQLLIIGGGPAGLCAGITAAESGATVLIIDENLQPGGQIYRQLPQTFQVNDPASLGIDYTDGQSLLKEASGMADRITIWTDATVWGIFDAQQVAAMRNNALILIDAEAIVVAAGAYERPVPVPGWTLPGVMTVGGAQALLKSQRVRPGNRVLVAGTGPLQLVVANQMLDAGMTVIAMAESAPHSFAWRYVYDMLHQPKLIKQGLQYLSRLKRSNVPLLRSYVLQSIEGNDTVKRATIGRIDAQGNAVAGETKSFDVDTVCIGYGLIPNTWLTRMLDCTHEYAPLVGGWVPLYDENMETDKAGVFVAGDGAGVAGVLVARCQGAVAGLYAAAHAGVISTDQAENAARTYRKKLVSLHKFRCAMDSIYQIRPDIYANITDDTIVCRCEGVTAGEIRKAIQEGTTDPNDIKKRTRTGMGYCQGTNCLPTIAMILFREFGMKPEEINVLTTRPPAKPIPMNLLMVDLEK